MTVTDSTPYQSDTHGSSTCRKVTPFGVLLDHFSIQDSIAYPHFLFFPQRIPGSNKRYGGPRQ